MVITLAENEIIDDTNSYNNFNFKSFLKVFLKSGGIFVCKTSQATKLTYNQFNLIFLGVLLKAYNISRF